MCSRTIRRYSVNFKVFGYASVDVCAANEQEVKQKAQELITEIDCGDLRDIDSCISSVEEAEGKLC